MGGAGSTASTPRTRRDLTGGATPDGGAVPGAAERAVPLASLEDARTLAGALRDMETKRARNENENENENDDAHEKYVPRVAVVGGGYSGCELAGVVAERLKKNGARAEVDLFASSASGVLPSAPRGQRASAAARLERLGVKHLRMAIGGSMGSMLALEWAATFPDFVTELVLIAGCGRHTDWAIGIGEAQRFSIMADAKFKGGQYDPADPPRAGLATSRMMAMLSYRAPKSVDERFARGVMENANPSSAAVSESVDDLDTTANVDVERTLTKTGVEGHIGGSLVGAGRSTAMRKPSSHGDIGLAAHANESASETLPYFAVESYLQYQGKKFIQRFDANCYIQLTYTLDSHDVARGRGAYEDVLRRLTHRALVVGITSDVLYPFSLQSELADLMPNAEMYAIDSPHGHDAFLIEIKELNKAIARFRRGERADPDAAKIAARFPGPRGDVDAEKRGAMRRSDFGNADEEQSEEMRSSSLDSRLETRLHDGELRGAVRALERELEKSRAREEIHARRANALLAEVARLRDAAEAAKADARGDGEDGSGSLASSFGYGLRLVPANPPPSSRRYQPVYGEVKSPADGADTHIAALGAF